jgi:hypothetical protein
MTSALEPITPKTSASPIVVDLLRGGPVVFEGDYYYPLAHLPKHDASDRCPVLTSWNPVMAKFAGSIGHK